SNFLISRAFNSESAAKREAQTSARESRQRLARNYLTNGIRHMEDGDPLGALPWLVQALDLDHEDPAREEMHRLRIGAILSSSPRLAQTWVHDREAHLAEFSPDGRRVAVGSGDGTVYIWDCISGQAVIPPLQHELRDAGPEWVRSLPNSPGSALAGQGLSSLAFSPDGRHLATARDKTVWIWETDTGKRLKEFTVGEVDHVRFSPDGKRLVIW